MEIGTLSQIEVRLTTLTKRCVRVARARFELNSTAREDLKLSTRALERGYAVIKMSPVMYRRDITHVDV